MVCAVCKVSGRFNEASANPEDDEYWKIFFACTEGGVLRVRPYVDPPDEDEKKGKGMKREGERKRIGVQEVPLSRRLPSRPAAASKNSFESALKNCSA